MSTPAPQPAPRTLAEIFPLPVQACLFLLLLVMLGLVGWKAWKPVSDDTRLSLAAMSKVDLNRADATELQSLHGIGPELAHSIVAHRNAFGPFEGMADVRKVPGIGPMTLEQLRPHVSLSWPAVKRSSDVTFEPARLVKAPEVHIDLNRASLGELQTLPGIGAKLAQRIIDQREKVRFGQISDLRKVPGIGVKTFDKLKPFVRVDGEMSARVQ